jgi:hypothetical protein
MIREIRVQEGKIPDFEKAMLPSNTLLDNGMKAIIIRRAWALVLELADRHG